MVLEDRVGTLRASRPRPQQWILSNAETLLELVTVVAGTTCFAAHVFGILVSAKIPVLDHLARAERLAGLFVNGETLPVSATCEQKEPSLMRKTQSAVELTHGIVIAMFCLRAWRMANAHRHIRTHSRNRLPLHLTPSQCVRTHQIFRSASGSIADCLAHGTTVGKDAQGQHP